MAIVNPVTENRVEPRPVDRTPVRAAEFDTGQTIGRAVEQVGRQGMQFAEQQNQLNIRYAETAARRARTNALLEVGEVRSRVGQAQLLDAEAARQQGEQDIERIRRERAAALEDPLARRMFEDSFEAAVAADRLRMREHADTQIRAAEQQGAEAAIDLATVRAVDMRGDPTARAAEFATIEENIRIRFRGAPEPVIQRNILAARSNVHRQTVHAIMVADEVGGGLTAMQYLRENAAEITPEHELSIFQLIQPQYDNDVIESGLAEVMALADSGQVPSEPIAEGEQPSAPREVAGTDYSPTRGVGSVSRGYDRHRRDNGRIALDEAAPAGTPIYPPTSGTVISAPREQQGPNGYMVRIRHPNDMVSSFLHLRGPSPLREGQEVTAGTIIGAVGNTGRSTGNHVDFSVRDTQGNAVDPRTVTWRGENLPLHTPRRHDLAAAYRAAHRVASERGYNSRQYEALLRRVDQEAAREERLVVRAQDEVDRRILQHVAQLEAGDRPITNISQVPEFGSASPQVQMQVLGMIQQNTRATEPDANSDSYLDWDDMAYGDAASQRAALEIDPRAQAWTRAEQRQAQRRQNEIRESLRDQQSPSNTAARMSEVNAAINRALGDPRSGVDLPITSGQGRNLNDATIRSNRARRAQLRDAVVRRVEAEQRRLGRPLTPTEVDGAVRAEAMMVTVRLPDGRTGQQPAYRAELATRELGAQVQMQVPEADAEAIRREFRARGVEPTGLQIWTMYRRRLMYRR